MRRFLIIMYLLSLGVPGMAAARTLNCQTRVIQPGDTAEHLRTYCGKPATIEKESRLFQDGGTLGRRCFHGSVTIEKWIYQRGFGRVNTEVTVVDGEVEHISSGAGGYDRGWRSPCS